VTGSTRPWLTPLTPLYRLLVAARALGLRTGFEPARRLRWPVVSIGSLSAGGAGKTPLTLALAQALARRGLSVDILSRGYGRLHRKPARVDPSGTAEEFGDEPLEMARAGSVPVFVAASRYEAGLLAERGESDAPAGLHLLDDGFQHRQLHRDLDILLLSRHDLRDHLLPAGNLREPLGALRRATILAIPAEDAGLARELRWQGPVWHLHRRMEVPPVGSPAVAFCGIARPEQFFAGLEAGGVALAARIAFPDHHRYTPADVARIRSAAQSAGAAALLTTEKDRVRLGRLAVGPESAVPLYAACLRIEIEDEAAALDALLAALPVTG
jgi:tetraacyldisaccharide 4'-kinase